MIIKIEEFEIDTALKKLKTTGNSELVKDLVVDVLIMMGIEIVRERED